MPANGQPYGDPPYNIPDYSKLKDDELEYMLRQIMNQTSPSIRTSENGFGLFAYPQPATATTGFFRDGNNSAQFMVDTQRRKALMLEAAKRKLSAEALQAGTRETVVGNFWDGYLPTVQYNPGNVPAAVNPAAYPQLNLGRPVAGTSLLATAMNYRYQR